MSIYNEFVSESQLISPVNGYTCRRISKQNIKQFGFDSVELLHEQYPDFPLMCGEYKKSRDVSDSKKFIENQNRINEEFEKKKEQEKNDYEKSPCLCPKCGLPKSFEKRNNQFCSRKCANGRGPRSESTKIKISKWAKENPRGIANLSKEKRIQIGKNSRKTRKAVCCKTCYKQFEVIETSSKVYCSAKCNPNYGGYRKGSGRSKSGYYNGIFCGSTYELLWVMYNIHHNINFERFDGYIEYVLDGVTRKYFPDFIQDNDIIEIKGYHTEIVDIKSDAAKVKGYNIHVLYQEDLEEHFKWFAETYPKHKLHEMFDDYKPKYTYLCDNCYVEFSSDVKKRTEIKFCSRKCSGSYSTKKNILEGRTGYAPASLP